MATSERAYDRARQRADQASRRMGSELRIARLAAGRSQLAIAAAAHISQSQLARIELGQNRRVSMETLTIVGAMVGIDVVVSGYAGPRVIRDTPQSHVLGRLRDRLGAAWAWRYEVLVRPGDQRAWDAHAQHRRTRTTFVVEAETRIFDVQALLRRVALKRDAGGAVRVVLLVAGTHRNRAAIAEATDILRAEFPCPPRTAWSALERGADPGGDALLVMGPTPRHTPGD